MKNTTKNKPQFVGPFDVKCGGIPCSEYYGYSYPMFTLNSTRSLLQNALPKGSDPVLGLPSKCGRTPVPLWSKSCFNKARELSSMLYVLLKENSIGIEEIPKSPQIAKNSFWWLELAPLTFQGKKVWVIKGIQLRFRFEGSWQWHCLETLHKRVSSYIQEQNLLKEYKKVLSSIPEGQILGGVLCLDKEGEYYRMGEISGKILDPWKKDELTAKEQIKKLQIELELVKAKK
jgi:hypothetical protein